MVVPEVLFFGGSSGKVCAVELTTGEWQVLSQRDNEIQSEIVARRPPHLNQVEAVSRSDLHQRVPGKWSWAYHLLGVVKESQESFTVDDIQNFEGMVSEQLRPKLMDAIHAAVQGEVVFTVRMKTMVMDSQVHVDFSANMGMAAARTPGNSHPILPHGSASTSRSHSGVPTVQDEWSAPSTMTTTTATTATSTTTSTATTTTTMIANATAAPTTITTMDVDTTEIDFDSYQSHVSELVASTTPTFNDNNHNNSSIATVHDVADHHPVDSSAPSGPEHPTTAIAAFSVGNHGATSEGASTPATLVSGFVSGVISPSMHHHISCIPTVASHQTNDGRCPVSSAAGTNDVSTPTSSPSSSLVSLCDGDGAGDGDGCFFMQQMFGDDEYTSDSSSASPLLPYANADDADLLSSRVIAESDPDQAHLVTRISESECGRSMMLSTTDDGEGNRPGKRSYAEACPDMNQQQLTFILHHQQFQQHQHYQYQHQHQYQYQHQHQHQHQPHPQPQFQHQQEQPRQQQQASVTSQGRQAKRSRRAPASAVHVPQGPSTEQSTAMPVPRRGPGRPRKNPVASLSTSLLPSIMQGMSTHLDGSYQAAERTWMQATAAVILQETVVQPPQMDSIKKRALANLRLRGTLNRKRNAANELGAALGLS